MSHSLEDLSSEMRKIDFCMLTSKTTGGALSSRPMSNNGDVDYDGTSRFFALESDRSVSDILENPDIGLTYTSSKGLFSQRPFFISIEGKGRIIRDRKAFEEHWDPDLDEWFEHGVDTEGLVMIEAVGQRVHYWDGTDEGELKL
ncbi:pyridoxamine 5'-phosphate oxidase [Rhodobacterales bacterium]|nr:pyridoxamine 5'-phosphate oxidase [Rhodobacterales bacterium]